MPVGKQMKNFNSTNTPLVNESQLSSNMINQVMSNTASLKIQRQPEVLDQYGFKKSTLYSRIKEGLIPEPISLGGLRAVGWIKHETQAVLAAMCAGYTTEQIKQLVIDLKAKRIELV